MGNEALIERAEIKAAMIEMGEKIAWGSDSAIIRELAAALKAAEAERYKLEISRSAWEDSARINRLRAEQAEADLAAALNDREYAVRWANSAVDSVKDECAKEIAAARAENDRLMAIETKCMGCLRPDEKDLTIDELAGEIERLRAENDRLREGLRTALEGWAGAAQYKGDYLLKKHGDMEEIAELRALLGKESDHG